VAANLVSNGVGKVNLEKGDPGTALAAYQQLRRFERTVFLTPSQAPLSSADSNSNECRKIETLGHA
jgi:hypothetical protein